MSLPLCLFPLALGLWSLHLCVALLVRICVSLLLSHSCVAILVRIYVSLFVTLSMQWFKTLLPHCFVLLKHAVDLNHHDLLFSVDDPSCGSQLHTHFIDFPIDILQHH